MGRDDRRGGAARVVRRRDTVALRAVWFHHRRSPYDRELRAPRAGPATDDVADVECGLDFRVRRRLAGRRRTAALVDDAIDDAVLLGVRQLSFERASR